MSNETARKTDLLKNCEAFYLMTRSVAMLGSKNSDAFLKDAAVIIDFLGRAYGWPQERTDAAAKAILGEMMRVGLVSDYLALGSAEMLDDDTKNNMIFYEIKGRAIEEVNRCEMLAATTGHRAEFETKNSMGYTSFHHIYEPGIRFLQIKKAADSGEITAMLQEALMLICGIGCESDIVSAQWILQNLVVWGEKTAALVLSFLWGRENSDEMRDYYKEIYNAIGSNRPVFAGDTPDLQKTESEKTCIIIAAIQSMIVKGAGKRDVDILFADLINCESLSFEEKIELIKKYKEGSWLNRFKVPEEKKAIGF